MNVLANMARAFGARAPAARVLPKVPRLELHVTHACNLACESCSHYANHGHIGNLDLAEADRWMAAWSRRVAVEELNLLGGEPTIHPRLAEFVVLARRHWPATRISIITNGFFLHRHPDLPRIIAADGNADLVLSIHHDEAGYLARLRPVFELLEAWKRDHGIAVRTWNSHKSWTRRYLGTGAAMLPFEDEQPRRSWEICPSRLCKQLHDGKLWKCAPLAYLGMQKAKYGLSEKWDPYLRYSALDPTCADGDLDRFLALEDEAVCSMCSAEHRRFSLPNPMRRAPQSTADEYLFDE
jgi:hypothetical protein